MSLQYSNKEASYAAQHCISFCSYGCGRQTCNIRHVRDQLTPISCCAYWQQSRRQWEWFFATMMMLRRWKTAEWWLRAVIVYWRLSLWTEYIDLSQEIACSWWLINALAHTYIYSWHWWNEDMDNSSKIWGGLEPVISSQCCRMFTYFFETSCKVAYRLLVAVFSLRSLQHQRKPSYQLYCHHQCMAYRHRFLFRHSASQFSHYKWRKRLPNYVYI